VNDAPCRDFPSKIEARVGVKGKCTSGRTLEPELRKKRVLL
jgi:hypothetical protein